MAPLSATPAAREREPTWSPDGRWIAYFSDASGEYELYVRANASAKSHAELDESETLDAGDPLDLGRRYRELQQTFPTMRILGGCCGTDHRHVAAICEACVPPRELSA